MIRLAHPQPGQMLLDPTCGAGTILAELWETWRGSTSSRTGRQPVVVGGDVDSRALRSARSNLARYGETGLLRWDATRLPFAAGTVDCIISNPPFGIQLKRPEGMRVFYRRLVAQLDRVLRPEGRAVLLVSDMSALKESAVDVGWKLGRQYLVRILGQPSTLALWQKSKNAIS